MQWLLQCESHNITSWNNAFMYWTHFDTATVLPIEIRKLRYAMNDNAFVQVLRNAAEKYGCCFRSYLSLNEEWVFKLCTTQPPHNHYVGIIIALTSIQVHTHKQASWPLKRCRIRGRQQLLIVYIAIISIIDIIIIITAILGIVAYSTCNHAVSFT